MITRRGLLLAGGAGLLIAHRPSLGQPAATIRRVGMLGFATEAGGAHLRAALKQGMQELGWLEGKNVEYQFVYADSDVERLDALAGELIGRKSEVIVVGSQQTAAAVQRATKTIPIVMAGASNVVGAGLVAGLAKPGGNITGITGQQEAVLGKLIGIGHEIAPGARRIALLVNESNPSHALFWASAQSACAALDLAALRVAASAPAQLGAAVAEIARQRAQAVVVVSDVMYFAERAKVQELMQTTGLPVAYELSDHVIAGGLLSYGADLPAIYRAAARYVDKILKGAKPADLAVEQASKYELLINIKTAKALGITIPSAVLLRANDVIQ